MKASKINHPAVRAFARVWWPKSASHNEAEAADAGFDGGEFSGPAHHEMWERDFAETAERVGARFGLTGEEMLSHYEAACHHEGYQQWESQQ